MFTDEVIKEVTHAAEALGIELAAMLAVADVESGGQAFALVEGRREPLIRFEAHYFDRRLSVDERVVARVAGLSSPVAGAISNPRSQAERWVLLRRAASIDATAAYESVSWGVGQVMGAHWRWLGYADVEAMVAEAREGVGGQVRQMERYIEKAGLRGALRDRNWDAFARGYNGPDYKRLGYHRKLAAAYRLYAGRTSRNSVHSPETLRLASDGSGVREVQRLLRACGHPLAVDGSFGPRTDRAVRAFQTRHALVADGIVGPKTLAALRSNAGGVVQSDAPASGKGEPTGQSLSSDAAPRRSDGQARTPLVSGRPDVPDPEPS